MVRIVVSVLLLLSLVSPPAAADPRLRIRTDHFELYTTAGERTGRDAINGVA